MSASLTESHYKFVSYSVLSSHSRFPRPSMCHVPLTSSLLVSLPSVPNTVVSGYTTSFVLSRQQILEAVMTHLRSVSLKFHGMFLKQIQGIPQGSILSVPLCNLYLREYEKRVLFPAMACDIERSLERKYFIACNSHSSSSNSSNSLQKRTIIRFVDDYLFLFTPNSQLQSTFTQANPFHIQLKYATNAESKWCGLIVSPPTVHMDPCRLVRPRGVHRVRRTQESSQCIQKSMELFLRPRLAVFRHVRQCPSLLRDIYVCVFTSLRKTLERCNLTVRVMRSLAMWTIRYLYQSIHVNRNVIQWIVFAAFLKSLRGRRQFASVCEWCWY